VRSVGRSCTPYGARRRSSCAPSPRFTSSAWPTGASRAATSSRRATLTYSYPAAPAPELIEAALERAGIRASEREIIQATPGYAAKGYIYTRERRGYSFPLVRLLPAERDFYGFTGSVTLQQLEAGVRVPGVDKRLMLIEPTPSGHVESPIAGREGAVARLLGVDTRIVTERVRTLERRRSVGRTGVYLKHSLEPSEGFGEALHRLSLRRPAVRKRLG